MDVFNCLLNNLCLSPYHHSAFSTQQPEPFKTYLRSHLYLAQNLPVASHLFQSRASIFAVTAVTAHHAPTHLYSMPSHLPPDQVSLLGHPGLHATLSHLTFCTYYSLLWKMFLQQLSLLSDIRRETFPGDLSKICISPAVHIPTHHLTAPPQIPHLRIFPVTTI